MKLPNGSEVLFDEVGKAERFTAKETHIYELSQQEIDGAPRVTYKQFRALAKRCEWTPERLVEKTGMPLAYCRELLHGRAYRGEDHKTHRDMMDGRVIAYWPILSLYQERREG